MVNKNCKLLSISKRANKLVRIKLVCLLKQCAIKSLPELCYKIKIIFRLRAQLRAASYSLTFFCMVHKKYIGELFKFLFLPKMGLLGSQAST